MITRDVKAMIRNCFSYADEINHKSTGPYPAGSRVPLRNIVKDDLLKMLAYIYDSSSADDEQQIQFLNSNLDIVITHENFLRFRRDMTSSPEFVKTVPTSLKVFVADDMLPRSQRTGYGVSISKYLINSFNDVGCAFIAFNGISQQEANRLADYIAMMNNYTDQYDLNQLSSGSNDKNKVSMDPTAAAIINRYNVRGGSFDPSHTTDLPNADNIRGMARHQTESVVRQSPEELDRLMDELNSLIGLGSVKKNLNNIINLVKVKAMREKMGLKTPDMSMHLVFSGNPGTGKTTVARLLAKIYQQLGVVSKGQLIEVDRSGLVEGYVGQTATKTQEVIDKAMGGILFIDEAYALTNKEGEDFGQEAVDTILKRMEDDRKDLVVIVAGYTDLMKDFINSNPGLKSRFNKFIEFPDYNGDELMQIFTLQCTGMDYNLDDAAQEYVVSHLHRLAENHEENFANGREVRNYFERCVERQASRVVDVAMMDASTLTMFKLEDVKED